MSADCEKSPGELSSADSSSADSSSAGGWKSGERIDLKKRGRRPKGDLKEVCRVAAKRHCSVIKTPLHHSVKGLF